jgi:hypothetical protein
LRFSAYRLTRALAKNDFLENGGKTEKMTTTGWRETLDRA